MAKAPKTEKLDAAGAPGEIVHVLGPEDGRWRGGLHFGPNEKPLDLSTVSAADWAEIDADPYLRKRRD